jgi:hypothetical protein
MDLPLYLLGKTWALVRRCQLFYHFGSSRRDLAILRC